jgi:hypothetical protein
MANNSISKMKCVAALVHSARADGHQRDIVLYANWN